MFTVKQANSFLVSTSSVKQIHKKYCRAFKSRKTLQAAAEKFQRSRTNSLLVLTHMCKQSIAISNDRYDVRHIHHLEQFQKEYETIQQKCDERCQNEQLQTCRMQLGFSYGPSKAFRNRAGPALKSAVHTNYLIARRPEQMLPFCCCITVTQTSLNFACRKITEQSLQSGYIHF